MSMDKIFNALGRYGGLGGLILGLVVLLVLALIKKDTLNRTVFKLAVCVISVFLLVAILILGPQILRGFRDWSNDSKPAPQATKTKEPAIRQAPPGPSVVEVRGSVTPIPKQPAYISIEGVTEEWPIDAFGKFSFKIPGPGGRAKVIVVLGDGSTQSGYYILSSEPLSISLKK
jgi:hypothetical protein